MVEFPGIEVKTWSCCKSGKGSSQVNGQGVSVFSYPSFVSALPLLQCGVNVSSSYRCALHDLTCVQGHCCDP